MDSPVTTLPSAAADLESSEQPSRLCVYTALMGGYEALNEQPAANQSSIPFICFTDDPELRSDTWQIRVISPLFALDPARSQRDVKLRPHVHLNEFDLSLYIDNAVLLTEPPEQVFERYGGPASFSLAKHAFRDSVLDEFVEVIKQGFDDPGRVFEQLNHYTLECPEVLEERPYWGGIQLRDHRDPRVVAMLDIWYAHVMRYSRRDQLSMNAAFKKADFEPAVMDIDNHSSWFHSWPITLGRDLAKSTLGPSISFSPPVARVRQLQLELGEMRQEREDILGTEAWRIGRWLTDSAERHPVLVGPALRALRRLALRRKTR